MTTATKIIIALVSLILLVLAVLAGYLLMKKPEPHVPEVSLVINNDALSANVIYPVIPGGDMAIAYANASIREDIEKRVTLFQKDARENAVLGTGLPESVKSTVVGTPSMEERNERYAAIILAMEWYLRGAAHPSHTIDTYTYDYDRGQLISLKDLFKQGADYLGTLSRLAKEDLIRQSREGDLGFTYQMDMLEEGTAPVQANFSRFLPLYDGLVIYFQEYQVAPYAAGPQQVTIPYEKLQDIIEPSGVLGMYLKKY